MTATGKLQPEVEVPIAPEVSGEITAIPVKEGQSVHRGDILLKIKPDNYQAQVEAQQSALSAGQAAVVGESGDVEPVAVVVVVPLDPGLFCQGETAAVGPKEQLDRS